MNPKATTLFSRIASKLCLSILILSASNWSNAQSLYATDSVTDIQIFFSQADWDNQLDLLYDEDLGNRIIADSVLLNGIVFDSVGVRYKGNSSYNTTNAKNPFNLKLDFIKGKQDYDGHVTLKLNNGFRDPSFLRDILSYEIARNYMPAPRANFSRVYINGSIHGVYANVEAIDEKFNNDHYYSSYNTFFKCNPQYGGGNWSDLVYNGTDSSLYYDKYEIKSDYGWNDLLELCRIIDQEPDSIEKIFNMDAALWFLAFNNCLVSLDSYVGGFKQNYYLYLMDNDVFQPIVWDQNLSFGCMGNTGNGNLTNTTSKSTFDPFIHEGDVLWPLIKLMLADARYRKMYVAHFKTILNEHFVSGDYETRALALQTIIGADIQNDVNGFYNYTDFTNNIYNDITSGGPGPGGSLPGIVNLMGQRIPYINGLSEFSATQPIIASIVNSPSTPSINDAVTFTANVTNASTSWLYYRYGRQFGFSKVEMFDDGAHDDGGAGDGVYGASVTASFGKIEYYIYAEGTDAGMFSPERAAYEFYTLSVTLPTINTGDLVINELMASNTSYMADNYGEFDDWIELYNNTNSPIVLDGIGLTDDALELNKWMMPDAVSIDANGYLIIWADKDPEQSGLHANFKLSSSGESVVVTDDQASIIDEVDFLTSYIDVSIGRYPNGTGPFADLVPTFNSENLVLTIAQNERESAINIYPNPASSEIVFDLKETVLPVLISIYDLLGQKIHVILVENPVQQSFDVTSLNSGAYYYQIVGAEESISGKFAILH